MTKQACQAGGNSLEMHEEEKKNIQRKAFVTQRVQFIVQTPSLVALAAQNDITMCFKSFSGSLELKTLQ